MARKQFQKGSQKQRGGQSRQPHAIVMTNDQAIGTCNTFGRLLTGENSNKDLLQEMVYTSNSSTAGSKSNVDSFGRTGSTKLLPSQTIVKRDMGTLIFANEQGEESAIVRCEVLGRQKIGDWKTYVPA